MRIRRSRGLIRSRRRSTEAASSGCCHSQDQLEKSVAHAVLDGRGAGIRVGVAAPQVGFDGRAHVHGAWGVGPVRPVGGDGDRVGGGGGGGLGGGGLGGGGGGGGGGSTERRRRRARESAQRRHGANSRAVAEEAERPFVPLSTMSKIMCPLVQGPSRLARYASRV